MQRLTLPLASLAIAAVGLSAPVTAKADFVQVSVNGAITSLVKSNGLLPAAFSGAAVGQAMSIVYTINTLTPNSGDAVNGFYDGALTAMTVIVNGLSFDIPVAFSSASSHSTTNSSGADSLNYGREGCTSAGSGCYQGAASFSVFGSNPVALTSSALIAIPDPALFTDKTMSFFADTGDFSPPTDFISASITSVTAVPLPAAAWLLISGLGGLGALARRRRLALV